jgi:hypothetical protein
VKVPHTIGTAGGRLLLEKQAEIQRLWYRIFEGDTVTVGEALATLDKDGGEDAVALKRALIAASGREEWNAPAIGWLLKAYTRERPIEGLAFRVSGRGWRLAGGAVDVLYPPPKGTGL